MSGTELDRLLTFPFFKRLERADVAALMKVSRLLCYPAGACIFNEGDPADALHIVSEGEVSIRKMIDGKTVMLATLAAGDLFGESGILHAEPGVRVASALSLQAATTFAITRSDLDALVERSPATGARLYRLLAAISFGRLSKVNEMYARLFIEARGERHMPELKALYQQLSRDWGI